MAKIVRWRPHIECWNITFVKWPRFFVCRNRKYVVMYLYRYKRNLKFLKKRYKKKLENAYLTVEMQVLGRQLLTLLSGQHCRKSFWSTSTNPGSDSVVCIKRTATKTLITKLYLSVCLALLPNVQIFGRRTTLHNHSTESLHDVKYICFGFCSSLWYTFCIDVSLFSV